MEEKEIITFFSQFPLMVMMGFVLWKMLNMFREDVREREKVIKEIYEKAFQSQQTEHEKALKIASDSLEVVKDFVEVLRENGCYAVRELKRSDPNRV